MTLWEDGPIRNTGRRIMSYDVVTARQVAHGVQNHVCRVLISGSGFCGYIEEEGFGDLEGLAGIAF